jgi:hypothetical protein
VKLNLVRTIDGRRDWHEARTLRPERLRRASTASTQEIFPTRVSVPARFQFQILDNPLLARRTRPTSRRADDDGTILGQVILQPIEFHHDGTRARGYMGVDSLREGERAHSRAGGALAFKIVRAYSPFFCVTISEAAEKVFAAIGICTIGTMQKYLWVRGVRGLVGLGTAALGGTARPRPVVAPATLTAGGARFTKAGIGDVARVVQQPWPDGGSNSIARRSFSPGAFSACPTSTSPTSWTAIRAASSSCARRRGGASRCSRSWTSGRPRSGRGVHGDRACGEGIGTRRRLRRGRDASSVDAFAARCGRVVLRGRLAGPGARQSAWDPRSLFVTMADADSDLRFDTAGEIIRMTSPARPRVWLVAVATVVAIVVGAGPVSGGDQGGALRARPAAASGKYWSCVFRARAVAATSGVAADLRLCEDVTAPRCWRSTSSTRPIVRPALERAVAPARRRGRRDAARSRDRSQWEKKVALDGKPNPDEPHGRRQRLHLDHPVRTRRSRTAPPSRPSSPRSTGARASRVTATGASRRSPSSARSCSRRDPATPIPASIRRSGRRRRRPYWSGRDQRYHPARAWYMMFISGYWTTAPKATPHHLRAVRGGRAVQ